VFDIDYLGLFVKKVLSKKIVCETKRKWRIWKCYWI